MQLFYSNSIKDDVIILDKIESNHCLNVLRYSLGDTINVVDGCGNLYDGKIIASLKGQCHISILKIKRNYNKNKYHIHIAFANIKNSDRIEWFVEKAIEIGVDEISFIKCNRSFNKKINFNRINKIAIRAMKQSLKAYLPKINKLILFKEFLELYKYDLGFICHLDQGSKKHLLNEKKQFQKNKTFIMIGPEGDFDKEELLLAKKYKLQSVTLGESRLRSETAGVVACQISNIINNINNE